MGGYSPINPYAIRPEDIASLNNVPQMGPDATGGYSAEGDVMPTGAPQPNAWLKRLKKSGLSAAQAIGAGQDQGQGGQQKFNPVQNYYNLGKGLGSLASSIFMAEGGALDPPDDEDEPTKPKQDISKGTIAKEPSVAVVGEGGEREYVVPESKVGNFAEAVQSGSRPNPSDLPPDQGYSPVSPAMRKSFGPPALSAPGVTTPPFLPGKIPGVAPVGAAPAPLGAPGQPPPVAPQLPTAPQRQAPGLLQRIAAGAIGAAAGVSNAKGTRAPQIDASGVENAIKYPGYAREQANYQAQIQRQQEQSKLNKEAAESTEAQQRGKYYESQAQAVADQGKLRPIPLKDGSLYDPHTGQIVASPKTISDKVEEFMAAGYTREQALAYAVGGKPVDPSGLLTLSPEWAKKNAPYLQPDANGQYQVPKDVVDKIVSTQNGKPVASEYEGVLKEYTNPQTGQIDYAAANKEYDRRLAARALASRPPSNALDPNIRRGDQSYQFNIGELNKVGTPIEQLSSRMGRLRDTIYQMTPQADALIAPELLSVMAGGQGSGLRMNEAEISRIIGGRTNWESIKAALNKWQLDPSKGLSVTPAQRKQINDLVTTVNDKLQAKQTLLDDARNALQTTDDPKDHRRIVSDVRQALTKIDQGTPGSPQGVLPQGGGKVIDPETAKVFYRAAGSDPAKARKLATDNGWKVQ